MALFKFFISSSSGALSQLDPFSAHYSHGSVAATTQLSSDGRLGAHNRVLWGSLNHGLLGEQGNHRPYPLGTNFRHPKKGEPAICSQGGSGAQIPRWEGHCRLLHPLCLCAQPWLPEAETSPNLFLLIFTIFSTWILPLIFGLCCFLPTPEFPQLYILAGWLNALFALGNLNDIP